MLIARRIKAYPYFTPYSPNKGRKECDLCGSRLWRSPGGGIYCDKEAIEHKLAKKPLRDKSKK